MLEPLDPAVLRTVHPADLERLATIAEQNLLEVRGALRRRSRRAPSARPVDLRPSEPASTFPSRPATREQRRGSSRDDLAAPPEPPAIAIDGRGLRAPLASVKASPMRRDGY